MSNFFKRFFWLSLAPCLVMAQENGPTTEALGDEIALSMDGCSAKIPKSDGCARLVCRGTGVLFGQSGSDLQEATKEANLDARGKLAQYLNDQVKVSEDMARVNEATRASSSDGGNNTSTSASRLSSVVMSSRAEEVLRGVVVLEREIDQKTESVVVKIGTSCQSRAVADAVDAGQTSAPAEGSISPSVIDRSQSPESFHKAPTTLPRVRQTLQSEDDF